MVTGPINVQVTSVDEIRKDLEARMDSIIEGAQSSSYFKSIFEDMLSANLRNAQIVLEYILMEKVEQNLSQLTSLNHVRILYYFSRYLDYKPFDKITKDDILSYFVSLRKPETDDPTHKWVGTHNVRQMILNKFFRWLYNHNEPDSKKWITPPCMQGIKALTKKEKSSYQPSDVWNNEEHAVFLKYCPSKRDCCYYSMAIDTAARPKELLNLKIKDIDFKVSSKGKQYAEVNIKISKTRPRTLPLIFSIPYIKDWIGSHPMAATPDSYLFTALSGKNRGRKLSGNGLLRHFTITLKNHFVRLSNDDSVPERDRAYIKSMLTKPWNPYIFRHSSLTEKSQILKESTLRSYAGWSNSSNMPNVYIHYFGNESSKSLLEVYGIEDFKQKQTDVLKGKNCPNCNESNKYDSKFCVKCRVALTYDAYNEVLEEQKEKHLEIQQLKSRYEQDIESMRTEMKQQFSKMMTMIQNNPKLLHIKPEVLIDKVEK